MQYTVLPEERTFNCFCSTLIFTVLGAEALLDGHRQALGTVSPGVQALYNHFSQHPRGLVSEA